MRTRLKTEKKNHANMVNKSSENETKLKHAETVTKLHLHRRQQRYDFLTAVLTEIQVLWGQETGN